MSKTQTPAPAVTPLPAAREKPQSLVITGPTLPTLHKAAALIRMGYVPSWLDIFAQTGQCSITLEIGFPDPSFVEAANAEMDTALEIQKFQHEKAIEEAAARLVANRERQAAKAIMDAKIAEQEAALAALRAAAGAN